MRQGEKTTGKCWRFAQEKWSKQEKENRRPPAKGTGTRKHFEGGEGGGGRIHRKILGGKGKETRSYFPHKGKETYRERGERLGDGITRGQRPGGGDVGRSPREMVLLKNSEGESHWGIRRESWSPKRTRKETGREPVLRQE